MVSSIHYHNPLDNLISISDLDLHRYIGPLGGLIGEFGGDVANQMTFVVTLLTYMPARYFELSYLGR
jgi:hypothetical protein